MSHRLIPTFFLSLLFLTEIAGLQRLYGQTFTVIHNFTGTDGADPWGSLVLDASGNRYGTTFQGGTAGYGTVFKIDAAGNESVLHSFNGTDGANPFAGLVLDASGNLYGTTTAGGAAGDGTVFKIVAAGNESVLHSFNGTDGANPRDVVLDASGNLYGTTYEGGSVGAGTVFKIDAASNESVLHSFTGGADGRFPSTAPILDASGNLYVATQMGGSFNYGTAIKIDAAGRESVLHSFNWTESDGAEPTGLILDGSGNLYGTTFYGGSAGIGTVFKIDAAGNEGVLHSFSNNGTDGADPGAGLVLDGSGNLYGTTYGGGSAGWGTVFKIDAAGNESVLHSFDGTDGATPGGLSMDASGNLYGATYQGGSASVGTVFKLTTTADTSEFGTIVVTTNSSAANFTISGPATFSGSGTSATFADVPVGIYTINFGSDDGYVTPSPQTQTLNLNGTIAFSGMYLPAVPSVQFSPSQLVFQSSNSTLSVTATNTGNANLQFAVAPYLTGPNSTDFSIAAGTTCTSSAVISASQSCTVNVEYSPKTDSSESATLSFSDNASDSPQMVSLSGTLQIGGPQIAVISPNPIVGSSLSQNVEIIGTGFVNGSVVNWADLTNGGTGTIAPQVNSPNFLSATMISGDETATWQFQVTNPGGTVSNCAAFTNPSGTMTLPCYSIQVLSPDLPHSYRNDYLFQNAPYCPNSTAQSSCLTDTDDPYGFFYRECTSFVAWRMNRDLGTPDPHSPSFFNTMGKGTWGAAHHWNTDAVTLGYVVDNSPEVGAIAQWVNGCGGNCSSGHVAYVEKVNGDGTVDISEYNYAGDDSKVPTEPGDHQFGIRTLSALSSGMVFIHIRKMLLSSDGLASGIWAFGNQAVGRSKSETLTISNPQSASIVITSAAIAGGNSSNFVVSDSTCSSGVPPNGTCAITVTFTPSTSGPRSSTLSVKGTAGTQILSMSGTGLAPLTVSQSLSFGNVALGDTSQKMISVVNKTGADLSITSVAPGSNEFAESDTCGTVLSYESSCAIAIAFSPAMIGARTSSLTIDDSATNSPQIVALSGTGIAPVQISPLSVAFGVVTVGKSSATKSIQIKNNSAEPLTIAGLSWGGTNPGDFRITSSTCSVALAKGATCSVGVAFSPTATGTRQTVLELTDGAITSPQTVAVTGTGK